MTLDDTSGFAYSPFKRDNTRYTLRVASRFCQLVGRQVTGMPLLPGCLQHILVLTIINKLLVAAYLSRQYQRK